MHDVVINIGNSVLQHGNYNDRIYLMKLSQYDFPGIIDILDHLAQANGYSKIFAKIPAYAKEDFIKNGFVTEASVPNFYKDGTEVFFMAKFLNETRAYNEKSKEIEVVLEAAQQRAGEKKIIAPGLGFTYRTCSPSDAAQMAEVYRQVFATYPFPIHNPDYISGTMHQNVRYFGVWHKDSIIALSSIEMDIESGNAEMTDFATLPEFLGRGLSVFLLQLMESEARKKQIRTAYSIARALSFGMNITFSKMDYIYSGTLVNNTNISGSFESMNIWYKILS